MYRVGFGYDIHRLMKGRPLFLGGVKIPSEKGLLGHSDGDCLVHAVIDALLGAMGEKDIGHLFPDTEPRYRGMRSTKMLEEVVTLTRVKRWTILNVDTVVLVENPRLAPFISAMKETLAPLIGRGQESLGIKAKTQEGMGEVGRGEAIAAHAVVLLQKAGKSKRRSKKKLSA